MLQHQFRNQESPEALLACQMVTWAKAKLSFHITMKQVYRDNYTFERAEALRQQTVDGNFNWLPAVRFVNADALCGANGEYDTVSETLLLNADLAGSDLAAQTFVVEASHHLETVLNVGEADTSNDEVEMSVQGAYMVC